MAGGYTVSPSYSEETGELTGFDVDGGYGGYRSSDRDIVEFDDGSRHHVFEDASIQEEGEFSTDDYFQTLLQSEPRIPDALAWAAENLPAQLITDYNQAVDFGDLDTINSTLEYILEQYGEDVYVEEDTELPEEDYDLSEQDQAVVDAITEQLAQQEPLGEEIADEWQSVADSTEDPTYAGVAAATAAFHAGSLSAEEAISWVFENYNIRDIARVYQLINS